ncbi:MAG: hypothetical protein K6G63_02905, partial [Eubacterium sp.]|nr:hypothetical protein [Eubacterium sp.]
LVLQALLVRQLLYLSSADNVLAESTLLAIARNIQRTRLMRKRKVRKKSKKKEINGSVAPQSKRSIE